LRGLLDRSRAPPCHPHAIAERIAERRLEVRRAHPSWGPVKVRAYLERRVADTEWPAASTIGELFEREGLAVQRKLRRRSPPSSAPFADCEAANDVWCIDFNGWFLTGDGKRCEPLTITDTLYPVSVALPGARSQHSRRLAVHHGGPGDERKDALPCDPDCKSRRRPAVRVRTRVDHRAHRHNRPVLVQPRPVSITGTGVSPANNLADPTTWVAR
jgi:hypothetical protein